MRGLKPGFHKALQQPYNTVATIVEIEIRSISTTVVC